MSHVYGRKATNWPLGIKMRYVKAFDKKEPSYIRRDILLLRSKQDWFLNSIEHSYNWELVSLEKISTDDPFNICKTLMEMKNKAGDLKLFLGVNWDNKEQAAVFTFPKVIEDEARDVIANIGPYLYHKFKKRVLKYLTPDAADRAKTNKWNEDEGRAVTEEDMDYEEFRKECDDMKWMSARQDKIELDTSNFLDNTTTTQTNDLGLNLPTHRQSEANQLFSEILDDGSVRTFSNQYAAQVTPTSSSRSSVQRTSTRTQDSDTVSELSEARTLDTRMTRLETNFERLIAGIERMNEKNESVNQTADRSGQALQRDSHLTPRSNGEDAL